MKPTKKGPDRPVEGQEGAAPYQHPSSSIRKRLRATRRFQLQFHSDDYVRFVKGMKCACGCGRSPCEVSHDPTRGSGGTWKDTHPLYPPCHRRLHGKGSKTFWAEVGKTRQEANLETQDAWDRWRGV